jgi:hypothetical protein
MGVLLKRWQMRRDRDEGQQASSICQAGRSHIRVLPEISVHTRTFTEQARADSRLNIGINIVGLYQGDPPGLYTSLTATMWE